MSIRDNIDNLRAHVPAHVTLVAVSKFHPVEMIEEAYADGQRVFGESRVQELVVKQEALPKDIEWHFIGSLQRNKVKQIVPFIHLIHSVDSERLLLEIEKQATQCNRTVRCLLQLHIAQEETKSGFTFDECRSLLSSDTLDQCPHIEIVGLMGMATFTSDEAQVRGEFAALHAFFEECKTTHFAQQDSFKEISMGMSDDYPIAIEEGSTMIRVGTLIFGHR